MADFKIVRVIGKGSFGKVMVVVKKDTQAVYAMKVLRKKYLSERGGELLAGTNYSNTIKSSHYLGSVGKGMEIIWRERERERQACSSKNYNRPPTS